MSDTESLAAPITRSIARNLDDVARIMGLSLIELPACAVIYAVLSPLLRGIPYGSGVTLVIVMSLVGCLLFVNRKYPPFHALFTLLRLTRPKVLPVMTLVEDRQ